MRDHHDADPWGGHGPIRGSGIKHDNCPGCEYCRPGEPAGAVGGVPPPELEQIIERMRRMAMDARQSRENPLNIEADGYYSGAEALEYFANQLAAASRVVRPEPDLDIEHELRMEWWLNHGHDGLYGDDGEMQCGQCHPVFDYKRAPLAEVKAAAEKARLERIKALLAAARVARGDASAEQEE